MDVHNVCLVVAILSLSVSGVVVWLAFIKQGVDDDSISHERYIRSLLQDIQDSRTHTQNTSDHESSTRFSSLDSPWQSLHRNLGNYFTRGYFSHSGKYHQEYTHSALTILPFFHDQGREFESCLQRTALAHNQAVSPEMTLWNRLKWDTTIEGVFKFKHKFKLHYGKASFMACDWGRVGKDSSSSHMGAGAGPERCGHAFIMQDPIMLAIADLGKCLLEPTGQPLCQQLRQNKTTVEEWVAARGNIVFKHILFHSKICHSAISHPGSQHQPDSQHEAHPQKTKSDHLTPQQTKSDHLTPQQIKSDHLTPHQLCEKNHETFIDNLQPETINHLITFITKNIHKLFSVVGIFEDLGNSLTLLNRVFRLPLHECEFLSRFSQTPSTINSKSVHMMKRNAAQDTLQNKIRKENISYKNMASMQRLHTNNEDEFSLLEAFKHIENSMIRRTEIPATSTSNSSIYENQESLDSMFDYDILDLNTSDNNEFNYSDFNTDVDINDSVSSMDAVRNSDFNYSDLNTNINGSVSSLDAVKNSDNANTSQNSVLYYEEVSESTKFDDSEEDDDYESDGPQEDLTPDSSLLIKARELQVDSVRTRLYKMFTDSEEIRKSLSIDLRIYKAVKQLYFLQKQLFFNSIKPM